jgi:hypothetical protein
MNKAALFARGAYIQFLNGDDQLIAEQFGQAVAILERGRAHIVSGTTLVSSVSEPREVLVPEPWKLIFHNSIPHPSTFVSVKLLRGRPFREDLRIASDYDFFLACYLRRIRFDTLPVPIALHHRGGASADVARSAAEVETIRRSRLGLLFPAVEACMSLRRRFHSSI